MLLSQPKADHAGAKKDFSVCVYIECMYTASSVSDNECVCICMCL
jgi:hypothetical protein